MHAGWNLPENFGLTMVEPSERFAPYDRILLDAPCSSDRHLLRKGGSAVAKWSQGESCCKFMRGGRTDTLN